MNLGPARLFHTCLVRVFAWSLGLMLLFGALKAGHSQSLDRIERERAQDMLSIIKSDIKKNYYEPTLKGFDLDGRFKAAEEKLKQASSIGQAFGIIAQAVLDLDDSHTEFYPPPRPMKVEYGWRMKMIGDKCYVTAVKPGSDAERKGLKVGDLVLSVEHFRPTRKEFWKMEYYYYQLSPRAGFHVEVQSPDAQPRELDLAAEVRPGKRVLDISDFGQLIREGEEEDRLTRHRFFEVGGVIVWKLPGFDFEPEQADSIMADRIKGHSALVLDLRNNGGGYVKTLEQLAGNFFDHDVKIADLKGRKEMKPMVAKTRGKEFFNGQVVVLVDSKSASASEIFARLMQLEKRGVVVGDRSMGAVMSGSSQMNYSC